jgi:hypothetical protein
VSEEQSVSQLEEILQVSSNGVDDEGAHKERGGPWNGPRHMFSGRKRNMNSPILPTTGPPDLSGSTSIAATDAADVSELASELAASEATLAPVARRGAPPQQVLDQIAAAGRIHERLRDSGQHLRFFAAAAGERARIELHDVHGGLVRILSAAEAIELAAGRRLG